MGLFDEVVLSCPECNATNYLQSKAGTCAMIRYTMVDAPPEVLADIEGTHQCKDCDYVFTVQIWMRGMVG